jgi:hypothetical protein
MIFTQKAYSYDSTTTNYCSKQERNSDEHENVTQSEHELYLKYHNLYESSSPWFIQFIKSNLPGILFRYIYPGTQSLKYPGRHVRCHRES